MFDQTVGDLLMLGALVLSLGAIGGVVVLLRRLGRVERRYQHQLQALPGDGRAGPEAVLGALSVQDTRLRALETRTEQVDQALPHCIQRVGLVRFNPFQDTGGDQSFAVALLDAGGDGVVLSSLHTRAATRFYAKAVKAGRTAYPLIDEEQQALNQALGAAEGGPG
jgi:hypothetical protein